MKRVCAILAFLLAFTASQAWAEKFDCKDPQYGKALSDLDSDGYFVKFKEQGGVSYYNFTGPCKFGIHERLAPILVYAFVNGRLYARITQTFNDDFEIVRQVATRNGGEPKMSMDGGWTVMIWDFPEKDMKLKIKYNKKTNATKSAMYYEPLRKELKVAGPELEDSVN